MKCGRDLSKKQKIKTMSSKRQQIHNYQQVNLKTKTNVANYNRNRITETEITWSVISGEGEKIQGIRSINGRYKIDKMRLRTV